MGTVMSRAERPADVEHQADARRTLIRLPTRAEIRRDANAAEYRRRVRNGTFYDSPHIATIGKS